MAMSTATATETGMSASANSGAGAGVNASAGASANTSAGAGANTAASAGAGASTNAAAAMNSALNVVNSWGLPYKDISFAQGESVFEQGDVSPGLYFLISGCVCLFTTADRKPSRTAASRQTLTIYNPGDFFGYKALIDNHPQTYSTRAVRPSMVRIYDIEAVKAKLQSMDPLIRVLLQNSVRAHEQQLERQIADYMKSVRERVAGSLVSLARLHGRTLENGILLDFDMSRKELAQLAGTIDESLTRQLAYFKSEGLIESNRKTILIKDIERLAEIS